MFSIRPGKTFHLSASPKNIAASLDPQIMPLSGAQREISDWSIERKHFRASQFAPRYLSSHKHQADILTLFLLEAQIQHDWKKRLSSWSNLFTVCSTYFCSFDVFVLSSVKAFLLGVSHNTLTPQCQSILI